MNKLTPRKFKELAEKALALPINTEDRLRGCIDKIFQKVRKEGGGKKWRRTNDVDLCLITFC